MNSWIDKKVSVVFPDGLQIKGTIISAPNEFSDGAWELQLENGSIALIKNYESIICVPGEQ